MKDMILSFLKDEDGLTTVEYAIAGALVAGTVVIAFQDLGGAVETEINCLEDAISGGVGC